MSKRMVGDVVVVVIDEIGEVTFFRDPMQPHVVEIGKKETVERAMAAVVEMLDMIDTIIPNSTSSFEVHRALEVFLKDFDYMVERITEQTEFSRSAQ